MALGYGVYGAASLDPFDTGEDSGLGLTAPRIPRQMRPQEWVPDEALPLDERIRRRMETDAALSTAPAPGRFSVLGAPMAGSLPQPDFVPEKPMAVPGTEDTFLNRLGPALAQIPTARLGPQASNFERFLASMLTSGARSWGTRRAQQVDAAEARQQLLERRAAAQNERNAQASANARQERIDALKASSAAEKKARAEREGWLTVPSYIARAMGDPKLTGTQVPPEKYTAMLATWRAKQSGEGSGATLDRREATKLIREMDGAEIRVRQMQQALDRLGEYPATPNGAYVKEGEETTAQRRYSENRQRLEADLREQEARYETAQRALQGMGLLGGQQPSGASPAAGDPGAAPAAPAATAPVAEVQAAPSERIFATSRAKPGSEQQASGLASKYGAAKRKYEAKAAAAAPASMRPAAAPAPARSTGNTKGATLTPATQRVLGAVQAQGVTAAGLDAWLNWKGPTGQTRREKFIADGADLNALRSALGR